MATVDGWSSDADRHSWRVYKASKMCGDTPTRPQAPWVAKQIVYWCLVDAPRFAYYVVLRMPMGIDAYALSPGHGERVVRLLYEWQEHIEPHLHLSPVQLRDTVLCELGREGARLRAGIRYARSGRSMVGGCR
jgi:hypothetical protein